MEYIYIYIYIGIDACEPIGYMTSVNTQFRPGE